MFDIITFGSATQDVFLKSKGFTVREEKKVFTKKGIYFSLGSKIPVQEIKFLNGGGGMNSAFTFKSQKFNVAYCGVVGNDMPGEGIKKKIDTK